MAGSLLESFFLIFSGAALLATLAMFTRQPLLVAYILLGVLLGPYGLGWVGDVALLAQISSIGIVLLLFLIGLDMQPQALWRVLREASVVTLVSSLLFATLSAAAALLAGFTATEAAVVGAAMMFSSTIIGIKLLPTTALHHRRSGEMMVGLLLLQDFLAIFVLIVLFSSQAGTIEWRQIGVSLLGLPLLLAVTLAAVRWLLLPLLKRFDRIGEYIFLLAIGWCFAAAETAELLGLSREIGAFLAGISIATSPIAQFIALSLKPLRDFFLILFFFSLGGGFNIGLLDQVIVPALLLAALVLVAKPLIFRALLRRQSESPALAWDLGFRLGQSSEFALLIAYVAAASGLIGELASHYIQAAAIITFLLSSYIVVFNFPNPMAVSERLRRD
ncbi:cation:proton antiporter [Gammaproteobacteria bacterium LSUCC0057]|uniref:Cation:proton antiporter n=1 Tax=Gammaproteobacteria bacterium LSUCC0057 TaxID=2559237 RepID=A0A4Y8UJU6_9GAMM|nr:cation:proton antiporter [Gammaproteobacteria bacterium LSUCC0057]